jgi:hypothetical protein
MARKTKTVTITAEGRDKGRTYFLTEMPARRSEKWAARAMMAIARSSIYIPDEIQNMGMAAIATIGLRALAGVDFEKDFEPLMDEMMECVAMQPDASNPQIIRPLIEDDTEEVATLWTLKEAILELHTGFSIAGTLSKLREVPAQTSSSPNTLTSAEVSA